MPWKAENRILAQKIATLRPLSFAKIAKELGITRNRAIGIWDRHILGKNRFRLDKERKGHPDRHGPLTYTASSLTEPWSVFRTRRAKEREAAKANPPK